MKKYILIALMAACGPAGSPDALEDQVEISAATDTTEDEYELTAGSRHGVWVYSPLDWIGSETKVNAFISFLFKNNLNEVYLSTNYATLASSALPYFLGRMYNNGIAVEALIGKIEWATSTGRPDMVKQLNMIKDFNARQVVGKRFKAVHLDIEPWIGTGTDFSWAPGLITSYQTARTTLAGSSLKLSADLAGSKAANLTQSQRQAIVNAVDRTTLMQYESALTDVLSRTSRFMNGITWNGHAALVAVRIVDMSYPSPCVGNMGKVDATFLGKTGYGGWALYHYEDLL